MVDPWTWRTLGARLMLVTASHGSRVVLCPQMNVIQTRDAVTGLLRAITPNDEPARLIENAPDHAAMAAALVAGVGRWEFFVGRSDGGEFCIDGLRHATRLDSFGVPTMTAGIRKAIAKRLTPKEAVNG